jgi:SpoVK/Ycf46/Vps4 family AAA+-type ATPase
MMGLYLQKIENNIEQDEPVFNNNILEQLKININKFKEKKDFYIKNNLVYKRGILLYGFPGNGKTSFIKKLALDTKDAMFVLIDVKDHNEVNFIEDFLNESINKNMLKIIIMEDIDGVDSYRRSRLLNMIDGVNDVYNTIFIATTNFPEKLDSGLTQRPSRFDVFYNIDSPNENSRKILIQRYFKNLKDNELEKAIRETKGYKGSYFKELYIISNLYDCNVFEAIKKLQHQLLGFEKFSEVFTNYT